MRARSLKELRQWFSPEANRLRIQLAEARQAFQTPAPCCEFLKLKKGEQVRVRMLPPIGAEWEDESWERASHLRK